MNVLRYDDILTQETKDAIIWDYVENKLSLREIMIKYNIKSHSYLTDKLLKDKMRSISEANKVAHEKHPERFKHTEESKAKMREKRLKYLKEHPENTAWRLSNESYPEKVFKNYLKDRGYDQKYLIIQEYSMFPYFIDFAFVDIKLAIEIDGSQHLLPERMEKDKLKDQLLVDNGWKVVRFTENLVKSDWNKIDEVLSSVIQSKEIKVENHGIFTAKQIYDEKTGIYKAVSKTSKKVERDENGYSEKQKQQYYNQRKIKERPSAEELKLMLDSGMTIKGIGNKYGISDSAIRKWFKSYNIDCSMGARGKKWYEKVCPICGKVFKPSHNKGQKFCSRNCVSIYNSKWPLKSDFIKKVFELKTKENIIQYYNICPKTCDSWLIHFGLPHKNKKLLEFINSNQPKLSY